jgi:Na+-exporting ATPase
MIVKKVWLPKVGIYTVNNSMDPNDPTQGTVTEGPPSPVVPPPQNTNSDFDHQRSAAALTFDIPADKAEKDQQNSRNDDEEARASELLNFLQPIALCNLATVMHERVDGEATHRWQTTGEPTEVALQVFAHRFNYGKKRLESEGWTQLAEFPFDSDIKRMSVVYYSPLLERSMVFTKGAVERVPEICTEIGTIGANRQSITEDLMTEITEKMDEFAAQGLRVFAVASRIWHEDFLSQRRGSSDEYLRTLVEQDLTLVGLVGIYDPPRNETKDAIRECSEAGIKVHMLTVSLLPFFPVSFPTNPTIRVIIPQQPQQSPKKSASSRATSPSSPPPSPNPLSKKPPILAPSPMAKSMPSPNYPSSLPTVHHIPRPE